MIYSLFPSVKRFGLYFTVLFAQVYSKTQYTTVTITVDKLPVKFVSYDSFPKTQLGFRKCFSSQKPWKYQMPTT